MQVVTQAVIERQARCGAELILGEEGIRGRGLNDGRLPERLQVEFEIAAGHIGEVGETVLSLGSVSEGVCVVADVDVHASLQGVVPENLREGVGEFIAAVGVGELKAVSTEDKAGIRILNGDRRGRGGRRRKIEVIVAAEVEADFVDGRGVETGLQRRLEEMTGSSVGQRETVAG